MINRRGREKDFMQDGDTSGKQMVTTIFINAA
jgi:hypothetical protein